MNTIQKTLIAAVFLTCFAAAASAQKLKAEDVIAKNLASIGSPEARAATRNIITVGNGSCKFLSTADLQAEGRVVIASEGQKFFLGVNLNSQSNRFADELFTYDGQSADAASPRQGSRSNLGTFVGANPVMIDSGLMGGELSTGWIVANVAAGKGKLSYAGIKKVDGKDTYALTFTKKGGSDLDVTLFFDKDTFHHVRTEYTRMSSAGIGLTPERSSQFIETRFKIVEEFGDHRAESSLNLTLPHTYRIVYSASGQSGTVETEWKFGLDQFASNQKFDPNTFRAPGKATEK